MVQIEKELQIDIPMGLLYIYGTVGVYFCWVMFPNDEALKQYLRTLKISI
jgi:hypothetical protein